MASNNYANTCKCSQSHVSYLTLLLKYFLLCLLETGEQGELLTLSITNVSRGNADCQTNGSVQNTVHKPNVGLSPPCIRLQTSARKDAGFPKVPESG